MATLNDYLTKLSDFAGERLLARVAGLTDDEYLWQPVPECWTVRPGPDGTARADTALPGRAAAVHHAGLADHPSDRHPASRAHRDLVRARAGTGRRRTRRARRCRHGGRRAAAFVRRVAAPARLGGRRGVAATDGSDRRALRRRSRRRLRAAHPGRADPPRCGGRRGPGPVPAGRPGRGARSAAAGLPGRRRRSGGRRVPGRPGAAAGGTPGPAGAGGRAGTAYGSWSSTGSR